MLPLVPFSGNVLRGSVKNHYDYEQHDTGGKKGLLMHARGIPHFYPDICGERPDRVENGGGERDGVAQDHNDRHCFAYSAPDA